MVKYNEKLGSESQILPTPNPYLPSPQILNLCQGYCNNRKCFRKSEVLYLKFSNNCHSL